MPPVPVGIVPHTHWDREWYASFQTFRVRLVHLVDELLDLLERDESYERFLLDGQTIVIDDYLEIRPDAAERLAKLAAAGRLQVGPWMVLLDEFMVSGETIVRDLQLGIERATELGAVMEVGYLPDMFGHVAQMPQIFRLAGFEHSVVWRGVPNAIDQTAFSWESPDGSRVRAEYLYGSYSNGRDLPREPEGLIRRAHGYEAELGPARLPGGGMLLMNGSDHLLPQSWLGDVVKTANATQAHYRFTVTSLPEYLADQPTPDDLPVWSGELRSGARANVLMGVASNRVDVHRVCAAAERALERRAEPLSALFLPAERYPDALLDIGWRNLVLNSAHDSSCACSADEVVDAVVVRYQEARQVGDALSREALHGLAGRVDAAAGGTLVVNPTRVTRGGLVQVVVPGEGAVHFVGPDGTPRPTQALREIGGEGFAAIVVGRKVRWVLEMIRGPEFAGTRIASVTREKVAPDDWQYTFHAVRPGEEPIDLEHLRDELLARGDADATLRFNVRLAPAREVLFSAADVPGFGWQAYRPVAGAGPESAVTAEGATVANEHLRVDVDLFDATFTVTTSDGLSIPGCNRLVDGGDGGDTYSYSPPAEDLLVDRPVGVEVEVLEQGPVRASLLVTSRYEIPTHAVGNKRSCANRSGETTFVAVATTVEVRADERFVRVHVELDNQVRDHRLRAHFPLPAPVGGSDAECAFAVVHRGLTAEGGPNEFGLPTFVSRRFVDCSDGAAGLALLHDGLLEYEVLTDVPGIGSELALTLLRCVGFLSRSELVLRPNPAGPLDPLEGPQLQGRHAVDYAVLPHRGDWRAAKLHDAADELLVPLERVRADGVEGAPTPATGHALRVDGAEVSAVLRDAEGSLVVRVYNASPETAIVRVVHGAAAARGDVIDLRDRTLGTFDGGLELRPWEIATLRFAD
ncbi:MAG: glycoside hydrolase family 38 C-terminal domain-containing protein [Acidimicrobiia bacterium]